MSSNKDKSTISLVKSVSFDMDDFTTLLKKIHPLIPEHAIETMWDNLKENADDIQQSKFFTNDKCKYNIDEDEDFTDSWEGLVKQTLKDFERDYDVFHIRYNEEGKLVLVDSDGNKKEMEVEREGIYSCEIDGVCFTYNEKKQEAYATNEDPAIFPYNCGEERYDIYIIVD